MHFRYGLLYILLILSLCCPVHAQEKAADLFNRGNNDEALKLILKDLDDFYSSRMLETRIPESFITLTEKKEKANLLDMFRNRTEKGFFVEENPQIADLHLLAARCYEKKLEYRPAINHCYQSLRFRSITPARDYIVFYQMAGIYGLMKEKTARINCLETAASLNPGEYTYSLELGDMLYRSNDPKRAIYHFERYVSMSPDMADPELYLKIANLYEQIDKYLETQKYMTLYLQKKPERGEIHYALGYLAYAHTGNYPLAFRSFRKSLELLPEKDIFRRARCREYMADMLMSDREYEQAINSYREAIAYGKQIEKDMESMKSSIAQLDKKISDLKKNLLKTPAFEQYEELQLVQKKKAEQEMVLRNRQADYEKLHPGKVRWNLAGCLVLLERLAEAVDAYRECLVFNYRPVESRENIKKLQLKISRGY